MQDYRIVASMSTVCMDALINQQLRKRRDVAHQLTSFFVYAKHLLSDAMSVLKLSVLVLLCSTVRESCSTRPSTGKNCRRSISKVKFASLVSVDVCSIWSEDWKTSSELKHKIYSGVKPAGGKAAGKYSK
jgi:hypothetical protein